ncbi:MAG TPA: hypothetical protein VEH58_07730, partial [Dehalococcoidales bacterium]|nr:hypothetical protein [Dehalococcoidales bacterium]
IAAHPGCNFEDMKKLKEFTSTKLRMNPEQVQIFCPAPSTYSALMYYTERDPFTGKPIFVEKNPINKERQKDIVVEKSGPARMRIPEYGKRRNIDESRNNRHRHGNTSGRNH